MTVIPLPRHGQWAWDLRGEGRAVRVSTHAEAGLLNLSVWRGDTCVGTVRLLPVDVAKLMTGLSTGLADLATDDASGAGDRRDAERLHELEQRLAQIESRLPARARQRMGPLAGAVAGWARERVGTRRPRAGHA
jgi:hypothetical protein